MKKPVLWHVTLWVVLFAAGVAVGYLVRDRRAGEEAETNAMMRGLARASQAQLTLVMIEQNRAAQLRPVLERELATDIRTAHQAFDAHGMRLSYAMPNLSEAIRRAAEYLARQHASQELVNEALEVAGHLKEGR